MAEPDRSAAQAVQTGLPVILSYWIMLNPMCECSLLDYSAVHRCIRPTEFLKLHRL